MNPNGPTLSCVGLRQSASSDQAEVFYRWLHFLGGETYVLGYLANSEEGMVRGLLDVLHYAFQQLPGKALKRFPLVSCIPSFVTVPTSTDAGVLRADDLRSLFASTHALSEGDWGRENYYVAKFGDRFFDRAAEETRAGIDAIEHSELVDHNREFIELTHQARGHLPAFKDWQPNQFASRGLASGDIEAWWAAVTQGDYAAAGLARLAQMWAGASAMVSNLETRETFEIVRDFFSHHQYGLWPSEWNTASLRESLGLPTEDLSPRTAAGAQQLLEEGTAVDPEAAANLVRASVSGSSEARALVHDVRRTIPCERWSSIIDKVEWPMLMIALGPLVEGHLDEVRVSQENDDGSDDAEWLRYERESANAMFLGSEDREGSILDTVFGEKVKIREIFVGRGIIDGGARAVVTINLRNIHLSDGFPVYWKPSNEHLRAFGSLIGALEGRAWVRCTYVQIGTP